MAVKKLVIGIDIRDLRISKAGTRTSLEEISNQFRKMTSEKYQFYFFDTMIPVYTGTNKIGKIIEHIRFQLWKQVILPLKAWRTHCNIIFCNDYFVPYMHLGYTTIPVFHDAFFYEYPKQYNSIWLYLFKKIAVPAAKKSPFIIAQSKYSKERIHYFTNIDYDKITPVYVAPKTLEKSINKNTTFFNEILRDKIHINQYILHVGTLEKRKNIPNLIKAFAIFKSATNNNIQLVLAGQKSSKELLDDYGTIIETITQCNLSNDVIVTGYITNNDLSMLYSNALAYIFPSVNEGFGVPVLEAFQFNLPALVANNTCLPEIGGDAVITFNPYDIEDIADKLITVINNKNLQKEMITKGLKRLEEFSWEKTANQLLTIFEEAIEKK